MVAPDLDGAPEALSRASSSFVLTLDSCDADMVTSGLSYGEMEAPISGADRTLRRAARNRRFATEQHLSFAKRKTPWTAEAELCTQSKHASEEALNSLT